MQKRSFLDRLDAALASDKKWMFLLVGAAFVVKLVYVIQSSDDLSITVPIMDSKYYDEQAQQIASGKLIRHTAFFMGPLYPYVLGAIYAVFGRDFTVVRILQVAGGAVTIALAYTLGRALFRPSAAFAGAAILALYGAMTFHEGEMLMMWLGTLINTATLVVLFRAREGYGKYAAAGFLVGVSALARANILLFLPVVMFWALFLAPGGRRGRKALLAAACAAVAIAPATIHNYVAARDFVLVTSNGGVNFYIGNSEEATGFFYPARDITFDSEEGSRTYLERISGREMKPSEISRYWFRRAFDFIEKHPGRAARLMLKKAAAFFNGYEVPQIECYDIARARHPILKLLFVNFWMVSGLGLFGMLLVARQWRRYFLLYGFVFSYALSIVLFFVTARYRIQVAPVLSLFAGHALVSAIPSMVRRPRSHFVPLVVLFVLVYLTRPSLFAFPAKEVEWRENIHRARRLSEIGRRAEALAEINRAVELFPEVGESYVQRAIIYKEAGNYFKAIDDYSKALRIGPDLPSVRYDLAQALRRVGMYGPAIEEYRKAIALDPVKVEAYNNLGITYTEMGDLDRAVENFEKVIEIDPKYVKAYNNLGAALAQKGDTDRAISVLEEAIRVNPKYANSYKNLAMVYVQLKKPREAYEYMSRYHDLKPDDEEASRALAKLRIASEADTAGRAAPVVP